MHVSERKRRITGTGTKDKTAVMGILERGGKIRTTVVPNRKKHALQGEVRKHVEAGAALYSDALHVLRRTRRAITRTRLLTMPCNTWMVAYTRTALRTSGRC